MRLLATPLPGVFVIENPISRDLRGAFCKTFHSDSFRERGLAADFQESYYSVSEKNVIRGMHFQKRPSDLDKLVYVPTGRILDVVLDLRRSSPFFGTTFSIELSEQNRYSLYIPKGCAHGFKSLADNTVTVYNVNAVYVAAADCGIRWDSLGFDWGCEDPIISQRDATFPSLHDFIATGEVWT